MNSSFISIRHSLRCLGTLLLMLLFTLTTQAQYDLLSAKKGVIPGGYNFWVYTPEDYYYTQDSTPLVLFLHGASLCGRNLNQVLRYGPIDAVKMGRDIPALIVAPQNPGGAWSPAKLNDLLEWMEVHYAYDRTRVYVLGMSLGGYGTLDFVGTYPEKVAAALALCGGCTLKDQSRLGDLPLWIAHGTADRAIPISMSKVVVQGMEQRGTTDRLRCDWVLGASHGALARYFYSTKTYEWLFSHSLIDPGRPVNRSVVISQDDLNNAYRDIKKRVDQLELELDSDH